MKHETVTGHHPVDKPALLILQGQLGLIPLLWCSGGGVGGDHGPQSLDRGRKPSGSVLSLTISTFSLVRLLSFSSILWMLCSRSSFFLFIRLFFSTSGFSCTSVSRERFSCGGYRHRSGDWMDPRVAKLRQQSFNTVPSGV